MAVYEATNMAAISLPFGANHLPLEALPWLERFERIYLWLDADEMGRTAAEKFAEKLGVKRTLIVNTMKDDPKGPKDANDALRGGRDLLKYIKEAKPLIQENILTFRHIKEEVIKRIINYENNKGILSSFEWFNKKVKGFRKGELTVLTGGTGSGKTTFLSQWSIDFMEKGIPTLWGSFEIRNDVLASNMLMQFARKNLIEDPNSIELYSRDFESLPLYFLNFHGSTPMDQILNTLDYAIYAFDVGHIIIDNLQFMLSGQARGIDKFDLQDLLISKLRDFATRNKVHITIVIHPKKIDEDHQDLSISSVFGTAKATQEADNIFILQNRFKYRLLDIRKNRFDGETGRVGLGYDKNSKRFIELMESEVELLNKSTKTVEDIFQERAMNVMVPIEPKVKKTESVVKKSNLNDLVDQDISYYENRAKKAITDTTNTIAKKLLSMKKEVESKIESTLLNYDYESEDIIRSKVRKAAIMNIISGTSKKIKDSTQANLVEEIKSVEEVNSSTKYETESKKKEYCDDEERILLAIKNKKQQSFVENYIPDNAYPEDEDIIPEAATSVTEPKDESITVNAVKEEVESSLSSKATANEITQNSETKEVNEPVYNVIGYSEWMKNTPKENTPSIKASSQQKPSTSPNLTKNEKMNTVFVEKKKTFGESYSSSKIEENRKKLLEVLRTNGHMTSKSKGRYGKSSSDISSNKS